MSPGSWSASKKTSTSNATLVADLTQIASPGNLVLGLYAPTVNGGASIIDIHFTVTENAVPWTATRKFLILTPVILFGVSWYLTAYNAAQLLLNVAVVLVQVVAKLPELHGVRLFSVNQSTVSDD